MSSSPERIAAEIAYLKNREEELAIEFEALCRRLQLHDSDVPLGVQDFVGRREAEMVTLVVEQLKSSGNEFLGSRWSRARDALKTSNDELLAAIEHVKAAEPPSPEDYEQLESLRTALNARHEDFERVTAEVMAHFGARTERH